jgi:acetyl-CoA carboxylase biotin carboxylase subunit
MRGVFTKILIANRGEIAVRVMRTCREMGIATVAIYSEADRTALHVRYADEAVFVGPAPSRESYLRIDRVIDAARRSGAQAVHPGYGFLSENPAFARACREAGLVFIGPPPEAMEAMGEKTGARKRMRAAGVPVVPGTVEPLADEAEAARVAADVGYPVMLKAAAGGGGKGMRRVSRAEDLAAAFRGARGEAESAFGDGRVYVEKAVERPRHVEIQVFADAHGGCIHLGERECSVQRRHQKVIEETPSPAVGAEMRARMGEVAVRAARAVGYVGAGTIEFLVEDAGFAGGRAEAARPEHPVEDAGFAGGRAEAARPEHPVSAARNFYFLEMNTRLQVEHPVTELVTGIDLVAWQIEVAAGRTLAEIAPEIAARGFAHARGHAVEARIYAEDPARGFLPSPGRIEFLRVPGGPGVRNDAGVYPGYLVPQYYDPMISKLSAWAEDRPSAIARLRRALSEYVVKGITTNVRYLKKVLELEEFRAGDYDTGVLERNAAELAAHADPGLRDIALAAAAVWQYRRDRERSAASAVGTRDGASAWQRAGRIAALGKAPRE